MKIIKRGDKIIKTEGFYNYEFDNMPKLKINKNKWTGQDIFLMKLLKVEQNLKKTKGYHNHNSFTCKFHPDINTTGYYQFANIRWSSILYHLIKEHNASISDEFKNEIFNFNIRTNIISRITNMTSNTITKNGIKYIKINRNQLHIIDALYNHGGYEKKYQDEKNKIFRYSEHSGVLDFNNNGLEKIIISTNKSRIDAHDNEIYLPNNMDDAIDYEYIFHTHPATPFPGARASVGILYEFPSIGDIYHFLDHYNDGITQGSIIVAPEGMYIIRKYCIDDLKIKINEQKLRVELIDVMTQSQHTAIKKYGTNFSINKFYSVIAQDTIWIDMINNVLNKFSMHIEYYPRIKNSNKQWVLQELILPVFAIEISKKNI